MATNCRSCQVTLVQYRMSPAAIYPFAVVSIFGQLKNTLKHRKHATINISPKCIPLWSMHSKENQARECTLKWYYTINSIFMFYLQGWLSHSPLAWLQWRTVQSLKGRKRSSEYDLISRLLSYFMGEVNKCLRKCTNIAIMACALQNSDFFQCSWFQTRSCFFVLPLDGGLYLFRIKK